MRHRITLALLLCIALSASAQQRKQLLDDDWQFILFASPDSNLSLPTDGWRTLDLPHDWSVEPDAAHMADPQGAVGPFTQTAISGDATGFTTGGEGWYRKTLPLKADGQQHTLYIEGAYNQADVWVNGQHACFNAYGYSSFRVPLDPYLRDGDNELLIRVRNQGKNTRWYAGAGIYRHVWLITTPQLHLDPWTTFVQAHTGTGPTVLTTLHNDGETATKAKLTINILDPQGQSVATAKARASLPPGSSEEQTLALEVSQPALWSPDNPVLYTAIVRVEGSGMADEIRIPFGFRTLSVSAETGLLINGQHTLLQGGCVHHDTGLLGAAAHDRAETRKLQLLKDQGFNAVRCSHNPPSEHFLHVCDSIGLLVIDEAFDHWLKAKNPGDYARFFPTWSDRDLTTLVRRDRNHPSVIMWSIGNEVPGRIEPDGLEAAERMRQTILALDPSRPINAAICSWDDYKHTWDDNARLAFNSLDVGGYNYLYDKYERDHEQYPQRVIVGTESYPRQAAENWQLAERHPYVIGDFVWTAIDYLGEAGIGSASFRQQDGQRFFQQWPWFNGWCGDIDLIGQKKPQSYFRDVVWHRSPITLAVEEPCPEGYHMAVSAWGWPLEHQRWEAYDEGTPLNVNVYSQAPRVRLYLNGQLIGEQPTSATYKARFSLPYAPGTLRAVNVVGGQETDAFTLNTPGEPASLRLTADRTELHADGDDLLYVTIELIDRQGQVITSDSDRLIRLSVSGVGNLLAAGNASPNDQQSFRSATPRLFEGRALAIIQAPKQPGDITLTVQSDGLPTASVTVPAH